MYDILGDIYIFLMFFREKLDAEASVSSPGGRSSMPKTRALVVALLERLNLLLTVTIAPEGAVHITRSFSITPETNKSRKNSLSSIDKPQRALCTSRAASQSRPRPKKHVSIVLVLLISPRGRCAHHAQLLNHARDQKNM